ncbi:uncharacterized protein PAC_01036 [Phialocephala subalpina]|uniref:BTB domain-containing protein n=1 Tax=Phialocephala subalpina TaxID=576137 RepID=A0A1L7WEG7_9HELO|nr:uncharacterized protein PAC_01036 [Phialocephala subalpina]
MQSSASMSPHKDIRDGPPPKAPRPTPPPPPAEHLQQDPPRGYATYHPMGTGNRHQQPPIGPQLPRFGWGGNETITGDSNPVSDPVPKKEFKAYLSNPNDLVTFVVAGGKKFTIHKDFVDKYAPSFRAAFNGSLIEGKSGEYTLEDVHEDVFPLFSEYLYTDKTTVKYHLRDSHDPAVEGHEGDCARQDIDLVQLWLLGQKYLMSGLQNHVMQHLKRSFDFCAPITPAVLKAIYDETSTGSPLRRLVVW